MEPSFDHLLTLSGRYGLFEHAELAVPRHRHGSCTDDVARLLVVIGREPAVGRDVSDLGRASLRFLADALGAGGKVRNRRTARGRWHGSRGVEDCWGRSIWAFGTTVNRSRVGWMRQSALAYFDTAIRQRSGWARSMAFAALGAAEVLDTDASHRGARALLEDAVTTIGSPPPDGSWPWPEPRLAYANAALAEALIAAGGHLDRPAVVDDGLTMLRWLLVRETVEGHLSPTPVGGSGPGDLAPGFDQQPIEVAALADACHRAHIVTGDVAWLDGIDMAARWFAGDNDVDVPMWDPFTGGGFDGLHARGPNANQGAESTLSLVSTLQHARHLRAAASGQEPPAVTGRSAD